MKILVIGGGGREHALVWKIKQSRKVSEVICAPGNGGIMEIVNCFPVPEEDIDGLLKLAESKKIDLTVVGPEVPLVEGIVDRFQEKGLRIFGPTKKAAQIEGSKLFAKNLMKKYNIPTADYQNFKYSEKALSF
ncbi:phosphoribosylamine--glycine ligase, partial [candidate division KSB1 bacterium]|nr:phosphoribosylamine--glycine ligase [candidate division KSB1 bacterium]